jgi:hypothetical protein
MNLHSAATQFSERLLHIFARDLPEDLQPWGDAILAELPSVDGVLSPVLWALGGGMFLGKSLFNRALTGGIRVRGAGQAGTNPPSPLQRFAFLAVVLSFAMLLSPVFREGIQSSLGSWNARTIGDKVGSLDPVTLAAKRQGDASGLAFAALRTTNMLESAQLAEDAVSKDPSLTWVLAIVLAQKNGIGSDEIIPRQRREAWVRKLEQWDPDNATPYILEAQSVRLTGGKWLAGPGKWLAGVLSPQDGEQLMYRKAWLANMDKAFAAPRYDSYFDRRMKLERNIFVRLGVSDPLPVAEGIFHHPDPSWWEIRLYSNFLLFQGDQALAAGHPQQAEALYSTSEHFAALMGSHAQTNYERMFSRWPQMDARKKLLALYQQWPQPEKELRSREIVDKLQAEREIYSNPRRIWEAVVGHITSLGIAVSVSSGLAILAMAGTLLGIGYFFSRQWLGFRASRRLNALMDGAGKYGPFVLFTSCICLYFTYRPYARLFRDYMYSSDGAGDPERMRAFLELRYFPSRIAPLHDLFWPVVIVVLSLVVVGFVWRWVKEAKKPVITAG